MAASKRSLPKGVWFQKKRLSGGEIVRYGYLGRGPGTIPLGREGSSGFHAAISEAMRKEPPTNTVHNLIWRYKQSPEYRDLADRTRADYAKQLDKIQAVFGGLSLRAMAAREVAAHIYAWRDSMRDSPRRADYAVTVLKLVMAWGVRRGLLEFNRAAGVEKLSNADRREKTWSVEQVEAFLSVASEPMKRAMVLALETGQRQGDLITLGWGALRGNVIHLRQAKTGVRVAVPISAALRECLDAVPRGDATAILTKPDGRPWEIKGNGFRSAWRLTCQAAGIKGVTFHDLRGTFVTRRLSEGWTPQEVAMCTGHTLRDLASLDTYADRGVIAEATAKRINERLARG
jgi:integrase